MSLQNNSIKASLNHEKFHSSYTITESGCKIWNKSFGPRGHPRFTIGGKWFNASRIILALEDKEIPENEYVLGTTCKYKTCIDTSHLIIGTPSKLTSSSPKKKEKINSIFDLSPQRLENLTQKLVKGRDLNDSSECWIYEESLTKDGYARFELMGAHRCTFELKSGIRLFSNQHLEKICKGPLNCINPSHWRILTKSKTIKSTDILKNELSPLDWEKFGNSYTLDGRTGCWLRKNTPLDSYGSSPRIAGYKGLFHRVSYQIYKGAIPPGMQLRHLCDTKPCGCPLHLVVGTAKEQGEDKKINPKNRGVLAGSNNPRATINEEQAMLVWSKLSKGISIDVISTDLNIKKSVIKGINKGFTWNFITGLPKKISNKTPKKHRDLAEMTEEDITEFWSNTKFEENKEDPCLIWQGSYYEVHNSKKVSKYSQYYWGGKNWNAYHIAYFLVNGFLPDFGLNLVMRHLCGNGLCVKAGIDTNLPVMDTTKYKTENTPINLTNHLKIGTRLENNQDNKVLGVHTGNDGTFKSNTKLDSREIRDHIRHLGIDLNLPSTEIIDILCLDVGPGTITRLLMGKTWADETENKALDRTYRPFGERSNNVKISELQAYKIRTLRLQGKTAEEVANLFGLSRRHTDSITYGDSWAHLTPDREGFVAPLVPNTIEKVKTTPELINKVIELYNQNYTAEQIATITNNKKSKILHTIEELHKLNKIERRLKRTKITDEKYEVLKNCFETNKTIKETCSITGLASSTVEKRFVIFKQEKEGFGG